MRGVGNMPANRESLNDETHDNPVPSRVQHGRCNDYSERK